jgi:hypothetical protein
MSLSRELNIVIEFVAPGVTGKRQPLDRRIFGKLKFRPRRQFDLACIRDEDPTTQDSIAMLLDAWKSNSQEEILDTWEPGD